MNILAQQQSAFKHMVAGEAPAADSVRELFESLPNQAEPRIGIYRQAYRSRLVSALAANFPVLQRALGDEAFEALALQFIDACPSRHPSIRWFGDALGEFLDARHDALPHPALRDLVELEWAICKAFDAGDVAIATAADFSRIAPEAWADLVLELHPSTSLLRLEWSIEPVWQSLLVDAEEGVEREVSEPGALEHNTLVWRHELTPQWRSLDLLEATCLASAVEGKSFSAICEAAAECVPAEQAAASVVGLLQRWIADGILALPGDA